MAPNVLGEGHEEVGNSVEGPCGLVGFADEPLDAAGVGLGLVDDPVVDAADDSGLSSVAEVRVQKSFVLHRHLGLGLGFRDFSDDLEGLHFLVDEVVVVAADDGVDAAIGLLRFGELSTTIPEKESRLSFIWV